MKKWQFFEGSQGSSCSDASSQYTSINSSFVRCCEQKYSLLWTPALRPCSGLVRLPKERRGIGRCVQCVHATCREDRLSKSEQLVGYFYSAPLLVMAYSVA